MEAIKLPLKLKLELFYHSNKLKVITLGAFLLVVLFLTITRKNIQPFSYQVDPSYIGVFGAVLGALVAGVLTLIGTFYVHNNQMKAKSAIHRKNVIYTPLFDELVENKEALTKEPYPFPHELFYEGTVRVERNAPRVIVQYTAWNRIKQSSRYIETPLHIKEALNELDYMFAEYINQFNQTSSEMNEVAVEVIKEHGEEFNYFGSLGGSILKDLVKDETKHNIAESAMMNYGNDKTDEDFYKEKEINKRIYEKCKMLDSYNIYKDTFDKWLRLQDQITHNIGEVMLLINKKYEKQKSVY